MRTIILAVALLLPGVARAEITAATCAVLELVARGSIVPEATKNDEVAVLDMQGRWVVSSWTDVEWYTKEPRIDELTACIARELLKRRPSIARNVTPDRSCPDFFPQPWGTMERIAQADPVMRACRPLPRCQPGDPCA